MATAQLQLISTDKSWKLDERTVEIGRAGVAQAREALASARTVENPLDATYAEFKASTYEAPGRPQVQASDKPAEHGQQQQIFLAA